MKKLGLLIAAALLAFLGVECIVSRIIGYPTYGVEMKVAGIRGTDQPVNIFKPHSAYWTVEGGNRVFKRNNVGLTGIDIRLAGEPRFIFVLGTSYIHASHIDPGQTAVSIFQKKLRSRFPEYQALNLGLPLHDPYDSFWRANYFEKKYSPARVFLVIESSYAEWFKRQQHPLRFAPGSKKTRRLRSLPLRIAATIMNHSSFCNLTYNLFRTSGRTENESARERLGENKTAAAGPDLLACILQFKKRYGGRFALLSIAGDGTLNATLREFCRANDIHYGARNLLLPGTRINGRGHLNAKGNARLGEWLYEAFIAF
jgi:hypothetical protein